MSDMSQAHDATLSLRVPADIKKRLERAASRTRRSRAVLTITALEKYLDDIEREEEDKRRQGLAVIASRFRGLGAKLQGKGLSAEEIDARRREQRGDD